MACTGESTKHDINLPLKCVIIFSCAFAQLQYFLSRLDSWNRQGWFTLLSTLCFIFVIHAGPSVGRRLRITKVFETGVELNWLTSRDPNGEVHYVIYYTPEGGREQSIDTESNLTHYNLTGLERNRVYTNIAVQAVNAAGESGRSVAIAQYTHTVVDGESLITSSSPLVLVRLVWCMGCNAILHHPPLQNLYQSPVDKPVSSC